MRVICNPMNLEYRYQFLRPVDTEGSNPPYAVFREAADPSLILFRGKYYLFPSMTGGFFTGNDLTNWTFHPYLQDMPIYDYAPDVHAVGDYLYVCASRREKNCSFYRSKDPCTEPFEEIPGTFPFWDPAMFTDEDGKLFLYWGCANITPIYGVELSPETLQPKTEPIALIDSDDAHRGYERSGENHAPPRTEAEIEAAASAMMQQIPMEQMAAAGMSEADVRRMVYGYMGNRPYIEGAWMTKHEGRYYLQYAIPGTQYNTYGDGCYVADAPLGPFTPCKNNPYSYCPGGFMTGAGHGSTCLDEQENFWHIASMRISTNYQFERRLGLWKAGFDAQDGPYCDQRYATWPMDLDAPIFSKPEWMLLSYGKPVTVSSGEGAVHLTDEDARTCWRASSSGEGEFACVDLSEIADVRAVQINFADAGLFLPLPEGASPFITDSQEEHWMDMNHQTTRWRLEGSTDGEHWKMLEDKWEAETDLSHDLLVWSDGRAVRYLRLTVRNLPYGVPATLSGIRVFGHASGAVPTKARSSAKLVSTMDMLVTWEAEDATGAVILWGHAPDKLWHSYMVYGIHSQKIGALVEGEPVYLRVDTFNPAGITEGDIVLIRN